MRFQVVKMRLTIYFTIGYSRFTNSDFSRQLRRGCGSLRVIEPIGDSARGIVRQLARIHLRRDGRSCEQLTRDRLMIWKRRSLSRVDQTQCAVAVNMVAATSRAAADSWGNPPCRFAETIAVTYYQPTIAPFFLSRSTCWFDF